jgi:hypothetical protein
MQQNETLQGLPGGTPMPAAGQPAAELNETAVTETPKPKERAPLAFETTGTWVLTLSDPLKKNDESIKELSFSRVTMRELLIYEDYSGQIEVAETEVRAQKLSIELIREICATMTGYSDDLILQLDPVDWLKIQFHIKFKLQKKQEEMTAVNKAMGIEEEILLA